MWRCPNCGEKIEAGFEVCWSCGSSPEGVVDPGFRPETDGVISAADFEREQRERTEERLVTVAEYLGQAEAHLIRSRLEAEGIHAYLDNELTIAMDWLLSNAIGGVKVLVAEKDAERARAVLAAVPGFEAAKPAAAENEETGEPDDRIWRPT
jgi:hypothetical protein